MKLKSARPWMIAGLSGAVMAVAYGVLEARRLERQTVGLRHELARHGSTAERVERLGRAHVERERLEAARATARNAAGGGTEQEAPLAADTVRPVQAIEAISRIGERHGVTLIFTSVVEPSDAKTTPETFRIAGWKSPALWRMDVRGSYAGVVALLVEVSNGDIAAIPVGVDMRSDGESTEWRQWRILFWM